jgi:hypothetical protein
MATLKGEIPKVVSPEPENVFKPVVSPILRDNIKTFVEEHSDFLAIYLFSTAREGDLEAFEATIYLEPGEYTITISMLANPNVLAPFLHWLDLLQHIYETWHPLYSYKVDGIVTTTHEDALAGNITQLYEMNLLNRDMVEKLGWERVMSTPAWYMTVLADGSVFLIPQLIYNGGQDEDYSYDIGEAATHLGLSTS